MTVPNMSRKYAYKRSISTLGCEDTLKLSNFHVILIKIL